MLNQPHHITSIKSTAWNMYSLIPEWMTFISQEFKYLRRIISLGIGLMIRVCVILVYLFSE